MNKAISSYICMQFYHWMCMVKCIRIYDDLMYIELGYSIPMELFNLHGTWHTSVLKYFPIIINFLISFILYKM